MLSCIRKGILLFATLSMLWIGQVHADDTNTSAKSISASNQNKLFRQAVRKMSLDLQCPSLNKTAVKNLKDKGGTPALPEEMALPSMQPVTDSMYINMIKSTVQMTRAAYDRAMALQSTVAAAGGKAAPVFSNEAVHAMEKTVSDTEDTLIKNYAPILHMSESELRRRVDNEVTTKPAAAPTFFSKTTAEIDIDNRVPLLCDARCETDLEWNIIYSLTLWKGLCFQCSEDFLTHISVGSKHWIATRVMSWLRSPGSKTLANFPLNHVRSESLREKLKESVSNTQKGVSQDQSAAASFESDWVRSGFELIDLNDPSLKILCNESTLKGAGPLALTELQASVCGKLEKRGISDAFVMILTLAPADTSCGPAEDYIACAKTDSSVELTFKDTKYSFLDVQSGDLISVGSSGVPAFSGLDVLLHEIGHWFGLPHVQSASFNPNEMPDIMRDTYSRNSCVSLLSISALDRMDEDQYQQRLTKGAGLRRPKEQQ